MSGQYGSTEQYPQERYDRNKILQEKIVTMKAFLASAIVLIANCFASWRIFTVITNSHSANMEGIKYETSDRDGEIHKKHSKM